MKDQICCLFILLVTISSSYSYGTLGLIPSVENNGILLNLTTPDGRVQLSGLLGMSLPSVVGGASNCSLGGDVTNCYEWGDYAQMKISTQGTGCFHIEWKSTAANRLEDCFDIRVGHWYGGGETYVQKWPIESEVRREAAHVTGDSLAGEEYGSVTENYWLISTGVTLRVDENIPFFISWSSVHPGKMCLVAKEKYPYLERESLSLSYDVCSSPDIKLAHLKSIEDNYLEKPTGLPDETMLIRPFWSTWAQYKTEVNQSIVLDFSRKIVSEGFGNSSHVEIDDDWETCYGEAEFAPNKFPNVSSMVQEIRDMGFRTTLWIHPFINLNCPSFMTGVENGYFVKGRKDRVGVTSWWQGSNSGIVDFTNEDAVTWWINRLELLRTRYGIDSFKFDAGETNWLPASSKLNGFLDLQPNLYTTKYVDALAYFGGMIEVRSGRRNQRLPIFTRMLDKDSRWGYDNGLKSLIPTLLHFGIVGYPFVLPDMIGGNAYGEKPSGELFVRWMQANAFMPSVQFSIVPWDYDSNAVQITRNILALREEYKDLIYAAANQAVLDGTPINRPVWWLDPQDSQLLTIDSEYLLGDDILVAPVLDEGAVSRDIYLPVGTWRDQNGDLFTGPQWIRNYPAPLQTLPFFRRV